MEEAVSMALSLRLAKCEEDNWYLRERVKELEGCFAEKQRVGSGGGGSNVGGSSNSNNGKQEAVYSQRR